MSFITAGIASDRITRTIELARGYAQYVRLTDAADVDREFRRWITAAPRS